MATCMGAMASLHVEAPTALEAFRRWNEAMTASDKKLVTWSALHVEVYPWDDSRHYIEFQDGHKYVNDGNDHLRRNW